MNSNEVQDTVKKVERDAESIMQPLDTTPLDIYPPPASVVEFSTVPANLHPGANMFKYEDAKRFPYQYLKEAEIAGRLV